MIESLRAHQKEYPRFAPYLEELIKRVLTDSQRTRKGDQELVLKCLRDGYTGLLISEIMEDTGLSHWDVRQILNDLMEAGKVDFSPKPPAGVPVKNWKPPRLYRRKR